MDILKVFVDEPFALEPLASEPRPRGRAEAPPEAFSDAGLAALLTPSPYARAYLAGSRLPDAPDGPHRVGLTTLTDPALYVGPLLGLTDTWGPADDPASVLRRPERVRALASVPLPDADAVALSAAGEREGFRALRHVLDAHPGALVLVSEPAPDGWDWILYARSPLRERLVGALASVPAGPARRLVMPYQKARGEHRFYLERWALDALPDYVHELP